MFECIPSFEILHKYSDQHIIFKCKIRDLLNGVSIKKIVNWKYNRPPDTIRCKEIAEGIYTKKQEIDWMLYMVAENDILHIIDGMHRIHSLQMIKKENSKTIDHLTPTIFGSNNDADWLYDKYVITSLRLNMTNGQTIDLFQSLNKSNPVPELYMFDTDQQKRICIEGNVNEWVTGFNTHFTSSKSPNIPNMNRDRFIEILDYVYTKYELNNSNSSLLTEKLYELNTKIKNNIPKKISENAIEKCIKTGCFLFLLRREQLQESI
jgi:hypothetical protein